LVILSLSPLRALTLAFLLAVNSALHESILSELLSTSFLPRAIPLRLIQEGCPVLQRPVSLFRPSSGEGIFAQLAKSGNRRSVSYAAAGVGEEERMTISTRFSLDETAANATSPAATADMALPTVTAGDTGDEESLPADPSPPTSDSTMTTPADAAAAAPPPRPPLPTTPSARGEEQEDDQREQDQTREAHEEGPLAPEQLQLLDESELVTLQDVLEELFPERSRPLTMKLLIHGIELPLDAPVLSVWKKFAHPDLFLYAVLRE
jgi:hypothetical protein